MKKTVLLCLAGLFVCGLVLLVQKWRSGGALPSIAEMEGRPSPRSAESGVTARALGKVEAVSEEIPVSSDVTGRIAEILVEEGDLVEKGAPLAKLEPFVYQSRVEAARAAVAQATAKKKLLDVGARSEEIDLARALLNETKASERLTQLAWERQRQLLESGDVAQHVADSVREEAEAAHERVKAAEEKLRMALHQTRQEELEAAEAEVDQRRHELAVAEAELEKTVLRAPIAGTIIRKNLRVGEAVSPFQITPIVTLADLKHLRVRAELDEIDIAHVRLTQKVELEVISRPGHSLHGKVSRIGKSMGRRKVESNDPNERTDVRIIEILIDIDEMEELPLGLRVNVGFLE